MSENLTTAGETLVKIQNELEKRYGQAFCTTMADGLEFSWFCKSGSHAKITVHVTKHAKRGNYLVLCVPKGVFHGLVTADEEDKNYAYIRLSNGVSAKIFANAGEPVYSISVYPWRNYKMAFNDFAMIVINTAMMA
jgi:hypothetical protein